MLLREAITWCTSTTRTRPYCRKTPASSATHSSTFTCRNMTAEQYTARHGLIITQVAPGVNFGYIFQSFMIQRTQWDVLDKPEQPCQAGSEMKLETSVCLARFMQDSLNCSAPLLWMELDRKIVLNLAWPPLHVSNLH